MARISANLGFLWNHLPLPEAIRLASDAGFDAVECHWPYVWPQETVAAALAEFDMPMLSINTITGKAGSEDFGLTALPGREGEFRLATQQAIDYARAIGCPRVQAIAGLTDAPEARDVMISNLRWACDRAADFDIEIVIEPKNGRDLPRYFLQTLAQSLQLIESVNHENLKLIFDCYHIQINEGNLIGHFTEYLPYISHVQMAAVPDRNAPDHGEISYVRLIKAFQQIGYQGYFGAEYRAGVEVESTLAWLADFQRL